MPLSPDLKIPITCPGCGRKWERSMRATPPGTVETCTCGATIKFQGDDLREVQHSMDNLFNALGKLGKVSADDARPPP